MRRGIGWAIAIPLADAGADAASNNNENKSTTDELGSALSRPEQVADIAVMLARNG